MLFLLVKSWIAKVLGLPINWYLELTGDLASRMSVYGRYYQPLTPGKFHPGAVTEQSRWPCSQEFTFCPQTRNGRSNSSISNSEMAPVNKGIPSVWATVSDPNRKWLSQSSYEYSPMGGVSMTDRTDGIGSTTTLSTSLLPASESTQMTLLLF